MKLLSYEIKLIVLVIIMFCAIFTPDFFSFSIRYILVLICGGYILLDTLFKRRPLIDQSCLKIIKGFLPFLVCFFLFQITRMIFDYANGNVYRSMLIHTFLSFTGGFVVSEFLVRVYKNLNLSFSKFINILMKVMVIQLVCVVLAMSVPSVRYYFNSLIIKNSYSARLAELAEASNRGFVDRSYGLSNNLFDSFGFITAIIIIILYAYGLEKNKNSLVILSLIMCIMPLVNARSGILLLLIGIIVVNCYYSDLKSTLKIIGIIILAIILFSQLVYILPESMMNWLSDGLNELLMFFSGSKEEGVFSKILGEDLLFPKNIIFGAGGASSSFNYHGIDNGYVNCIWNFGLIGSALLFGGYLNMFREAYKIYDVKYYKVISVCFAVLFFVYLIKIYPIDNFGINTIIFGIPVLIITSNKIEPNNSKAK